MREIMDETTNSTETGVDSSSQEVSTELTEQKRKLEAATSRQILTPRPKEAPTPEQLTPEAVAELTKQQEALAAAYRTRHEQAANAVAVAPVIAAKNYPEIKGMATSGSIYMHPDVERLMYNKERNPYGSFADIDEVEVIKKINEVPALTQDQRDSMQELVNVRFVMQSFGAARRNAEAAWNSRNSEDYYKQIGTYQRGLRFFHMAAFKYDQEIIKMPGVVEALTEMRKNKVYFKDRDGSDKVMAVLAKMGLTQPVSGDQLTAHQIESAINMAENYLYLNTKKYADRKATNKMAGFSNFLENLVNPRNIPVYGDPKDPKKITDKKREEHAREITWKVWKWKPDKTHSWKKNFADFFAPPGYEVLRIKTEAETMGAPTINRVPLAVEAESVKRWGAVGGALAKMGEAFVKGLSS